MKKSSISITIITFILFCFIFMGANNTMAQQERLKADGKPAAVDKKSSETTKPAVTGKPEQLTINKDLLKPDLVITKMKIDPANPTTKDTIRFSALVTNNGKTAAPPFRAGIQVGGETLPVILNQPAIQPQASQEIVRSLKLDRPGKYIVKFIADVNGAVAESNENNNIGELNFTVVHKPFLIAEESMITYTTPGNSNFTFYLRPSKPVNTATVTDNAIQVQLRLFRDGALQNQETLAGTFTRKDFMEWKSVKTWFANACTGTPTSYCLVDVTLQDSIMSQDGEQLDGDSNGQPGGNYHHQFHRGMAQP